MNKGKYSKGLISLLIILTMVGAAFALPATVFDVSNGQAIGEVDAASGNCQYLANGNLICPGTPAATTTVCLEAATEACGSESACVLAATQECVGLFNGVDAAGLAADSCGVASAWANRVRQHCPSGPAPCTVAPGALHYSIDRAGNFKISNFESLQTIQWTANSAETSASITVGTRTIFLCP